MPLILVSIQLAAQNAKFPKLKITGPCSDEFINHYKGKWLIHKPINVAEYHDEVMNCHKRKVIRWSRRK